MGLNGFDLVRGIPSPQAVFERIGSELKRAAEYVADVAITVSSVAIEIGISLIPGVGEAEDISVIVDPESTATEKAIATTSLTLSVATAGATPNAGRVIKAKRKATNSRDATPTKGDASAAHDSSSPPAPRAEAASAESANASNTTTDIGDAGHATSRDGSTRIGYHATKPEFAASIRESGFRPGEAPGRLGSGGVYVNSTPEGALAEFAFHRPNEEAFILRVEYKPGVEAIANVPPLHYTHAHPLAAADSISAPSVRAPDTVNTHIMNGSAKVID